MICPLVGLDLLWYPAKTSAPSLLRSETTSSGIGGGAAGDLPLASGSERNVQGLPGEVDAFGALGGTAIGDVVVDRSVGYATDMGWLQPGQGTVLPNAFSVTFKVLIQWGQSILNDMSWLPSSEQVVSHLR